MGDGFTVSENLVGGLVAQKDVTVVPCFRQIPTMTFRGGQLPDGSYQCWRHRYPRL